MTKKSFLIPLLGIAFSSMFTPADAALSVLSRANCLPLLEVNESITYDKTGTSHFLYTFSDHQRFGELTKHTVRSNNNSNYVQTWRSYAGHNGDTGKSTVRGTHYILLDGVEYKYKTYATNCNLTEW